MSIFLKLLSDKFPDDLILLCIDNASYHRSKELIVPTNIERFFLPPRTPEMNPTELLWREIRKRGFKNKVFDSMAGVIAKFHEVVNSFSQEDIQSLTLWSWIDEIVSFC